MLSRKLERLLRAPPLIGVRETALLGSWFGFVDGLVDGVAPLLWFAITGDPREARSPLHLWMAPFAGALLGAAAGCALGVVLRARRGLALGVPVALLGTLVLYSSCLSLKLPIHPNAALLLSAGLAVQLGRLSQRRSFGVRRVVRRSLPVFAAWILLVAIGQWGWYRLRERLALKTLPPAVAGAPNVLLLIWDTVRATELSLYGYPRKTTPELERWAASAVTFERAIAPAPWTLPSHASMFTGWRPHDLQTDYDRAVGPSAPTLAEVLARRGYATAGFVANMVYTSRASGLARGFAIYRDYGFSAEAFLNSSRWTRGLWTRTLNRLGRHDYMATDHPMPQKSAAEVNREFLDWKPPVGRPFFAFLNYLDAHAPYVTRRPFETRFTARPPRYWEFRPWANNTPAALQEAIDAYDSAIAYLDHEVGALLDELERRGVLDNTVLIIASDHGEQFGEHGLTAHGNSLYMPLLHVPLVIRYPRRIPAGLRVSEPVQLRFLAATVLDLVGANSAEHLPGVSLLGRWTAGTTRASGMLLSEVTRNPFGNSRDPVLRGPMHSLLHGNLHYILNGDGKEELYDVGVDSGEVHNLVPSRASELAEFRRILEGRAPAARSILRQVGLRIAGRF